MLPNVEIPGSEDIVRYRLTTSNATSMDPRINTDSWEVIALHLHERLNEPYAARVSIAINEPNIDGYGLLQADVLLEIIRGHVVHELHGKITRIEDGGGFARSTAFQILIEPAFAMLDQRIETRIFQNKSAKEILDQVLTQDLLSYERKVDLTSLRREYTPREYCVQYQESDLAFCCRLMEEEGIAFHFDHLGKVELLTLSDGNPEFTPIPTRLDPEPVPSAPTGLVEFVERSGIVGGGQTIVELRRCKRTIGTGVWVRDFDWTAPDHPVEAKAEAEGDVPKLRQHYDHSQEAIVGAYDGRRYTTQHDSAKRKAKLGRQRQLLSDLTLNGVGYTTGMQPGRVFLLVEHPQPEINAEYFIVGVDHYKCSFPEMTVAENLVDPNYMNTFECIAKETPFVPSRWNPKPQIASVQTARVCGPTLDEPHTDEHGRIKLHFPWDRDGSFTEEHTCWVRVSQPMAGPGWGHQSIPHVGMEAVVSFIDGNPDRPLVIGCVYNGTNASPFQTPDHALESGLRTVRNNELRMTDVEGSEEIYLHAERNLREVVGNHHSTTVKGSQSNVVYGSQVESVGGNQTLTVHHDRNKTIKDNETNTVEKNRSTTIQGNDTLHVQVDRTKTIAGNEAINVTGLRTTVITDAENATYDGTRTVMINESDVFSVNGDKTDEIANNYLINVQTLYALSQGDTTLTLQGNQTVLDGGDKITIQNAGGRLMIAPSGVVTMAANSALTLMCGSASLTLTPKGISLSMGSSEIEMTAAELKVNGTAVSVEGSSALALLGAQITGN